MNSKCPTCSFVFDQEPGYFLGAIIIAYFVSAISLVPTIIILGFVLKMDVPLVIGAGILQVLLMHPFLYRYSKLGWLHVEGRMTRKMGEKDR